MKIPYKFLYKFLRWCSAIQWRVIEQDLAGALRLHPQYEVAARNLEAAERQMAEETAEKEVVRVSLPVVLSWRAAQPLISMNHDACERQ